MKHINWSMLIVHLWCSNSSSVRSISYSALPTALYKYNHCVNLLISRKRRSKIHWRKYKNLRKTKRMTATAFIAPGLMSSGYPPRCTENIFYTIQFLTDSHYPTNVSPLTVNQTSPQNTSSVRIAGSPVFLFVEAFRFMFWRLYLFLTRKSFNNEVSANRVLRRFTWHVRSWSASVNTI